MVSLRGVPGKSIPRSSPFSMGVSMAYGAYVAPDRDHAALVIIDT
jgi:hypothetical protein